MEEATQPSQRWFEKIAEEFTSFQPPEKLHEFLDVDAYPEWVIHVSRELFQQASPTYVIERLKSKTPETVGLRLGQNCASFYALAERLPSTEEEAKQRAVAAVKWIEVLEKYQERPEVDNLLKASVTAGE